MTDRHIEGLKQQQAELHHVSEHLANERTILAWVRTAIAIMTLGIAINRFSLFLIEFARTVPGSRMSNVHAEEAGIGLVIVGVIVMLGGIWLSRCRPRDRRGELPAVAPAHRAAGAYRRPDRRGEPGVAAVVRAVHPRSTTFLPVSRRPMARRKGADVDARP